MDPYEFFEQQLVDERNGGSFSQYASQPVEMLSDDLPLFEAEQEDSKA